MEFYSSIRLFFFWASGIAFCHIVGGLWDLRRDFRRPFVIVATFAADSRTPTPPLLVWLWQRPALGDLDFVWLGDSLFA